jgi:prolyl oligopeptidase
MPMKLQTFITSMAFVLMAGGLASCAQPQRAAPAPAVERTLPPAAVRPVSDTYVGTTLVDNFRWLEDVKASDTQAWMKAASERSHAALAAVPGRDALVQRIAELEAASTERIGRVVRLAGDQWVYETRGVADNQFKLVVRQGLAGAPRVLVDPVALSRERGAPVAMNYFAPSPNGRHVAYGLSERGSEATTLHVMDMASGRDAVAPITRADYGNPRWSPDGQRLAFNRLRGDAVEPKDKYKNSAAWLLDLPGGAQRELLGPNSKAVAVSPDESPGVVFSADGQWLFGLLEEGVRREGRVVIARAADLAASGEPKWRLIIEQRDAITQVAYARGMLYALTHKDAPRFKIIAAPVARFSAATAAAVVPASTRVLGALVAAKDALYIDAREGNAKQLWKLGYGAGAKPQPIALPVQGSFALGGRGAWSAANPAMGGVAISLQSTAQAPQLYTVDAAGAARNTGLQPAGRFDAPTDLVTTEALVPSHDGALVPVTVIHTKGLKQDGSAPTWMLGYAAYGFSMEPRFAVNNLAWLERGGVIAIVNPRGSGVFGQAWYEAGKQATKPNTWRDMIAVAEWLVKQGYTRPGRLAIEGGSAGGITSGRAATERPDLFAAVVPRVGVLDMVRAELEPNGPPNIPEFGSHKTEAGFKALYAMSTYHHIQDGVRYPAVLLTHGVNDPRVAVWHSSKTAARFDAVARGVSDARPVLLRLDYDAGHGIGNTKEQAQRERADIWAFLLWQMGVEGFQPTR